MIYFDNAATSFPKPQQVLRAQENFCLNAGNAGRGSHQIAMNATKTISEIREELAAFFGIKSAERLIFTPGCTYSINMAIKGLNFRRGDNVLVSALEHDAIMRPLKQLEKEIGIVVRVLPYAKQNIVDLHDLLQYLLDYSPKLCAITHASNVTGEVTGIEAIANICGAHKVPLLVDASQTAGKIPISLQESGISIWVASGHKGLMGVPGVGLLYVADGINLKPSVRGGTSGDAENFEMPTAYPDHLEPGTLPGPAIAALGAGLSWLNSVGLETIFYHEQSLASQFIDWAASVKYIQVYGNESREKMAVLSFSVKNMDPQRIAKVLDTDFKMAVRAGLHSAELAHTSLNTLPNGLVRVGFGYFNTEKEVELLCATLAKIALSKI